MSKSWPLAAVVGLVLAGGALYAADEAPVGSGDRIQCSFTDNSQLKLKNTASRGQLARGVVLQVKYKIADGTFRMHEVKLDSDLQAGHDITVRVPVERGAGATCSAKIQ